MYDLLGSFAPQRGHSRSGSHRGVLLDELDDWNEVRSQCLRLELCDVGSQRRYYQWEDVHLMFERFDYDVGTYWA